MHERALISATASNLLAEVGGESVGTVTLALAPETDPAVVDETWRSVTMSTPLADAALRSRVSLHGLVCLGCGDDYEGDKLSKCPVCGSNGLIVSQSPEVALVGWTLVGGP